MTDTPRLLAINNYFYKRGGAEAVFLDHIRMFEQAGWDVVPFAMQHPDNEPSKWSDYFVSEIEYGRQPGLLTKASHAAKIIYSFEARKKLSALIDKVRPGVAHAHNVYHHISPSIFATLREAGVPTVMTVHDLKLACPAYKMLSHGVICEKCKGGRIHNVLLNRCIKDSYALSGVVLLETIVHRALGLYRDKVDRMIVPSRFYLDKLVEWGWAKEQLVHVPNFVDATEFTYGWEKGDHFLFAGRLAPEKGLTTLIRAAAISGCRVVIAGAGPDEQALKRLAEEISAPVEFRGYVSGAALTRLIGEAKALILPSEWYENAPISLLEAYASGTPVIGADIGGIPEMIRDGETGFSTPSGDADSLARVMRRMAELGSNARADMGANAREWVMRDFSPSAYRERTLGVYRELGVAA